VKKLFGLLLLAALSLAGCATFGIQGASFGETREGVDYKLLVNAWDKKASDLGVVFSYRVNGGPWQQKPGIFNGSLYEAAVAGSELSAGYLEYYASMRNAKGETVASKSVTVKILSFAEAKAKAEREYLARISDATEAEFAYDEPAAFRLGIGGSAAPYSVTCDVTSAAGTRSLAAERNPSGLYAAAISPPHNVPFYSYRWTVLWQDPVFGQIASIVPAAGRSVPVLDQAAVRARVDEEFKAALRAPSRAAGTYFSPPVVQARLDYGKFAKKYSTGPRQVSMILRRAGYGKQIVMNEVQPGLFSAVIPSADLEQGPAELSFLYSDSFSGIGPMQAQFPVGQGLPIAYKSLEDFRQEAVDDARAKLAHQPPADAIEGQPLTLALGSTDAFLDVESASFDSVGPGPAARGIPFFKGAGGWSATLPGAAVRSGALSYIITVVVRDQRFGDLAVTLPREGAFSVQVKSIAQVRKEREEALQKSLSHAIPANVVQDKSLGLTLQQSPVFPNESASLFYRTAESPRFRELRAQYFNGNNTFMLDAAATRTAYIQYYFTVTMNDPAAGVVTATLRERTSGGGNDFIVAPQKEAPAPPGGPASPGGIEPPAKPLSFFTGPQADRAALRFFVQLDNEPGLYDITVSLKFQGVDKDFRAYPLERKGKEYSYSIDARSVPAGNRVEFSYSIYRKGVLVQTLANADGTPFSALLK
jgi:hypothetical protein